MDEEPDYHSVGFEKERSDADSKTTGTTIALSCLALILLVLISVQSVGTEQVPSDSGSASRVILGFASAASVPEILIRPTNI
jgi:hypothetical protein